MRRDPSRTLPPMADERQPLTAAADAPASVEAALPSVDAQLASLSSHAAEWAALPLAEKAALLAMVAVLVGLELGGHLDWGGGCVACQGMEPASHELEVAVEALLQVSIVKGHCERLATTLRAMAEAGGAPPPPPATRTLTTAGGEAGGGAAGAARRSSRPAGRWGRPSSSGRRASGAARCG